MVFVRDNELLIVSQSSMMDGPMQSKLEVIPVVITQHAEADAFYRLLHDAAACAPHYSLADLAKLDHRLEANMDGLRVAGAAGWEMGQVQLG
jgi:hypothetical protein